MASVLFHRGTEEAPPVRFNGEYMEDNRMEVSLEGGGFNSEIGAYYVGQVQQIVLTADPGRDLAVGAVYRDAGPRMPARSLECGRPLRNHRTMRDRLLKPSRYSPSQRAIG